MDYKVILADDEEEMLQSIRRQVDWESYGFEVVGTFLNGRDVMEFLENREADIVLTDIRMPFMDGMELAKNIRERYPQMKVIIISGYGDFKYAKEAMSYQVSDYILKPVNAREMGEVLQRVRELLDREMEERRNIHLLEKQYVENLPIIRENVLNRLVVGDIRREDLPSRMESCRVSIGESQCWAAALIELDKTEHLEEGGLGERYQSVYLRNLIRERFRNQYHYEIFYSRMGECIIFGMQKPEQIERILLRLNGIAREGRRIGVYPAIGVGKVKTDLMEIKASFEEAREALMYRKMVRDSEVIYMEDIDFSDPDYVLFDESSKEMLFSAIKFGEENDIRLALQKIYEELKKENMSRSAWQAWSVSLMNALLLFAQQYYFALEKIFAGKLNCMKILSEYEDMDSFFQWLETGCLDVGRYFEKERIDKAKNFVEIAEEYMEKEYGNPEISLESVAKEIGLTPTYFSSMFKKETGESFVEYLTRLRMEEAMRILKETDEKIYTVAEKTGYPDAGYFSHVFKKRYGISPIQYRRQRK